MPVIDFSLQTVDKWNERGEWEKWYNGRGMEEGMGMGRGVRLRG